MEQFGDAVILCGGASSRMSYDKSFIRIGDRYLVELLAEKLSSCFTKVRLGSSSAEKLCVFSLEVVEDLLEGRIGPAVGIYSALKNANSEYVFVTACDMPYIDPSHIEFMKQKIHQNEYYVDALVPINGRYIEPLYSFYSIRLIERFEEEILAGNFKIHSILKECNVLYLDDSYSRQFDADLKMFSNINYDTDLEKFR